MCELGDEFLDTRRNGGGREIGCARVLQGFRPQGGQHVGERRAGLVRPRPERSGRLIASRFVPPHNQAVQQKAHRRRAPGGPRRAVLRLGDPQMSFRIMEGDLDLPFIVRSLCLACIWVGGWLHGGRRADLVIGFS